jgi:hypothetical protein
MAGHWNEQTDVTRVLERVRSDDKGVSRMRSERRRFGRIRSQVIGCNLGLIQDVSAGGLRIERRRPLSGEHRVEIHTRQSTLTLRARVAWSKSTGWFRRQVGLEFIEITDEQARILREMTLNAITDLERADAA